MFSTKILLAAAALAVSGLASTANAAPYDLRQLGPAKLDSLYTASIIALHADTGRLAWFYQTTPRDSWDYDSVQKLILADVKIGGATQPVIMQASKNGFFYVLDRTTGKLISAQNYTYVNWASHIDLHTGRPVLTSNSDWYASPKNIYPSWAGGHTWNPMSYSGQTHLVYIPVLDVPSVWVDLLHNGGTVKYIDGFFTVNGIIADDTYSAEDLKRLYPAGEPAISDPERVTAWSRRGSRARDPASRQLTNSTPSGGMVGPSPRLASIRGRTRCRRSAPCSARLDRPLESPSIRR